MSIVVGQECPLCRKRYNLKMQIEAINYETGVFCCSDLGRNPAYHKLADVNEKPAPPAKKVISEFPGRCIRCGGAAYVGLNEVIHRWDADAESCAKPRVQGPVRSQPARP